MNRRLMLILVFAFVVAAAASWVVYRITGNQLSARAQRPTTKIVIAARDLETGVLVRATDLTMGDWLGTPPKGAIVSKDAVLGRGVVSPLYQGEPILESRLAPVGSGGGLAAIIKPGMRACAVKVNEVVGLAGFVVPGMRVDVVISGNVPGSNQSEGPRVRTLLQNIEVLSAGTNIQKDAEGKPVQVQVVNLLVTPEQAELLSLASNETRIQLVLRNPLDTDTAKPPGITMANLLSDGKPAPVKAVAVRKPAPRVEPPPPQIYLIEVLNGNKRSEAKFGEKGEAADKK